MTDSPSDKPAPASDSAPAPVDALSFEEAMAELEAIVRQLEAGDAPLDAAVDLYTRGETLKAHCERRLAAAQERIEKITVGADGKAAGTVPFDDDRR